MAYYQKHIFFCVNERREGKQCCHKAGADEMRDYAKKRAKELGIKLGHGQLRVNKAGCLGRCTEGPICVVYPDAVWYTYKNTDDIDEILERHIVRGEVVERLRLPD